ncbi:MAG: hypothetical protein IJ335_05195 [Lachnospiraceae bacterium]|nr:hypothetical protein [Lachnospiraceae bacterium]
MTATIIWIIVSGILTGIGIAWTVVGVKISSSNVHGDNKTYIEDFVEEGGMCFLKQIDL